MHTHTMYQELKGNSTDAGNSTDVCTGQEYVYVCVSLIDAQDCPSGAERL